ncbi:MAG: NADH-quinone oxidoreductase subunit K [Candidatus Omnitrophota bacterium]
MTAAAGSLDLLWFFGPFIAMLFIIGFYCIFATYNLIRALIGVELLIKAVTLLSVVVGYISGYTALTQALIITMIVIEVVVMVVAIGIILGVRRFNATLDVRNLRNLKG